MDLWGSKNNRSLKPLLLDVTLQLIGIVTLVTDGDKLTPTEGLGRAPDRRWQQRSQRGKGKRKEKKTCRIQELYSLIQWLPNPELCHLMRSHTVIESLPCLPCCLSFPLCRSLSPSLHPHYPRFNWNELVHLSSFAIPPCIHTCWRTVDY